MVSNHDLISWLSMIVPHKRPWRQRSHRHTRPARPWEERHAGRDEKFPSAAAAPLNGISNSELHWNHGLACTPLSPKVAYASRGGCELRKTRDLDLIPGLCLGLQSS